MAESDDVVTVDGAHDAGDNVTLGNLLKAVRRRILVLVSVPLLAGLAALGGTYLMTPTFTATVTFIPPQQASSNAAAALAALGSLGGLAGAVGGGSTPADRYVALMQSVTVADRLVQHFGLMQAYEKKLRVDAREQLALNTRFAVGRKDGMITVEVDDYSPQRAADIANRYVDELRVLSSGLAVTEAQQRRLFFERQIEDGRNRLTKAQAALLSSGFNSGALKAEPKAAADAYARLKAEAMTNEVRLQMLRGSLADNAPEVRQQQAALNALRGQIANAERVSDASGDPNYIGKYREFKYQEALFDIYARQYELARADESREGALIQIVDRATPPERKSKPKRARTAIGATIATWLVLAVSIVVRASNRVRAHRGDSNG